MNIIATAILNMYSTDEMRERYETFEWKGRSLPVAWMEREDLAKALGNAIDRGSEPDLVIALAGIHRWGLAGRLPAAIGDNVAKIVAVLSAARKLELPQSGVIELLNLPGIGIATASKWFCFANQDHYAIYDSRVSIALRDIRVDGVRQFPVAPRRATRHRPSWPDDRVHVAVMAERYAVYIDALKALEPDVALKPPQIEMALFMIGDVACVDRQGWRERRGVLARAQPAPIPESGGRRRQGIAHGVAPSETE